MAATDEDRRQAATIYTSISTYVATAALGVLAGAIALLTYFSQQYHNLEASYVAIAVAVAVLVASLVAGGYGVNKVAKEGATGSWGIQARNGAFNTQAICALVGTLLVVLSGIPPILRSPEHLRRKRCWKDGLECRNRSRRTRSSSGVRRSS